MKLSAQASDILQRVSDRDLKGIKTNIEFCAKRPDEGRPTSDNVMEPQRLKHICRDSRWIIEYRYEGCDPALRGDFAVDAIYEYARL